MNIEEIQSYLNEHELDGWLMADFHARNNIAVEMLALKGIITRRSFYYIPASGLPTGIVHHIEKDKFGNLPGKLVTYTNYKALEKELASLILNGQKIAMEYSPKGRLPYIGLVDAGTIELIRDLGAKVISSANLVAYFQANLNVEQIALHRIAANNLIEIKTSAFEFIRQSLTDNKAVNEYDVVHFILDKFEEYDMETDSAPICAVDANAGNPHYEPSVDYSTPLGRNQLVLIDLWAKVKKPEAVYGDITWMAYTGHQNEIPSRYNDLFDVIARARDAAVDFIRGNAEKQPVYGCDVDDICRAVITETGYGDYFTHRTGHSITTSPHGTGPNIDNLETEDKRKLRRGHLFSIEPGIYLPDCGFRTEIDVLYGHNGCEVTTLPLQKTIIPLF